MATAARFLPPFVSAILVGAYFMAPYIYVLHTTNTVVPASIDGADAEIFYSARTQAWVDGAPNSEYAFFQQTEPALPFHPFLGDLTLSGLAMISGLRVSDIFLLADLVIPIICFIFLWSHFFSHVPGLHGQIAAFAMILTPAILHGPNIVRHSLNLPLYLGLGGGIVLQRTLQPQVGLVILFAWIAAILRGLTSPPSRLSTVWFYIAHGFVAVIPWASFHCGTALAAASVVIFLLLSASRHKLAWQYLRASLLSVFSWLVFIARYLHLWQSIDPRMLRTQHIDPALSNPFDRYDAIEVLLHCLALWFFLRRRPHSLSLCIWLSLALGIDLLKFQGVITKIVVQPFHWRVYVGDMVDIALVAHMVREVITDGRFTGFLRKLYLDVLHRTRTVGILLLFVIFGDASFVQWLHINASNARWRDVAAVQAACSWLESVTRGERGEVIAHQSTLGVVASTTSKDVYFHEAAYWGSLNPDNVVRRHNNYSELFANGSTPVDSAQAQAAWERIRSTSNVRWILWGPKERSTSGLVPETLQGVVLSHRVGDFSIFSVVSDSEEVRKHGDQRGEATSRTRNPERQALPVR